MEDESNNIPGTNLPEDWYKFNEDGTPRKPWWEREGFPYEPSPNSTVGKQYEKDDETFRLKLIAAHGYRNRLLTAVEHVVHDQALQQCAKQTILDCTTPEKTAEAVNNNSVTLRIEYALNHVLDAHTVGEILALAL